jgi:hypothetical protein
MPFRIGAKEILVGTCITCIAFEGRLIASEVHGAIAISPTTLVQVSPSTLRHLRRLRTQPLIIAVAMDLAIAKL